MVGGTVWGAITTEDIVDAKLALKSSPLGDSHVAQLLTHISSALRTFTAVKSVRGSRRRAAALSPS